MTLQRLWDVFHGVSLWACLWGLVYAASLFGALCGCLGMLVDITYFAGRSRLRF